MQSPKFTGGVTGSRIILSDKSKHFYDLKMVSGKLICDL